MAEQHYDGACKSLARVGGLIYGWHNAIKASSDQKGRVTGGRRDLDSILKVCEGLFMMRTSELITDEQATALEDLCATIVEALTVTTGSVMLAVPHTAIDGPSETAKLRWATMPGRW